MDEKTKQELAELLKHADPKLLEKYGNPLDENDPKMWPPSKRAAEGLSLEDQLKYLGLDMEAQSYVISDLMKKVFKLEGLINEMLKAQLIQRMKDDPEGAAKQLMSMMGMTTPDTEPNTGLSPDALVATPNGQIRADQIPGYKNEPGWKPSPDWIDANCMCEKHQEERKAAETYDPFKIGPDDPPTGMYL